MVYTRLFILCCFFLIGSIKFSSGNSEIILKITKTDSEFTVIVSLPQSAEEPFTIIFTKMPEQLLKSMLCYGELNESASKAIYRASFGPTKEEDTVYVNDNHFAVVHFKNISRGVFALNGVIGDMVITYDNQNSCHTFSSDGLENFDAKESFQYFLTHMPQPVANLFPEVHIRLLVVLDTPLYEILCKKYDSVAALTGYLTVLFTAAQYRIGIVTNKSFSVSVTQIIGLENTKLFPESSKTVGGKYKAEEILCDLGRWVCDKKGDYNLATLLTNRNLKNNTGEDVSGFAFIKGAGHLLRKNKSGPINRGVMIVKHQGNFDGISTFVHELFHLFGADHEYETEATALMSEDVSGYVNYALSSANTVNVINYLKYNRANIFLKESPAASKISENVESETQAIEDVGFQCECKDHTFTDYPPILYNKPCNGEL